MNNYLETAFDELYPLNKVNAARRALQSKADGEEEEVGITAEQERAIQDVDVTKEDELIRKTNHALKHEKSRLKKLEVYLEERRQQAWEDDEEIREKLLEEGLTQRYQYPVEESVLQLDDKKVSSGKLILPHSAVAPLEKRIEISTGKIKKHPNQLAQARPDAPNYLKETASLKVRKEARGAQNIYTEEQKEKYLKMQKNKPKPKGIPPAQQVQGVDMDKNNRILERMQIYRGIVIMHRCTVPH